MDIAEVMKKATPRERTVIVCVAGDAAAEVDRLEAELARHSQGWQPASLADKHPGEKIARQIEAARQRMREAEVEFRFRAIGHKAWSDLVAEHPSGNAEQRWNTDTFPPALIAAACIDPVMTPEQVGELLEVLNEGQADELFNAAYEVNAEPTQVPFSLAASAILASTAEK
jgi:hypothetical protein